MEKPKIIFIMTDTTRFDMLGCYGNKQMITPNIDKLASEGIRFDRAYTCQPVCGPARSAIFTGMYPHSNGSWANSLPLYANVKTIGQRLKDTGVETAYIGKWHLDGSDYFGNGICPDGWNPDYWYDMRTYLYEMDIKERFRSRLTKTMLENGGIKENYTFGHKCTDKAIDFVEKFKDDSFFLTLSYDEPHGPSLCPEPFSSMYKGYKFPESPNIDDKLEGKPDFQKYWAEEAAKYNNDGLNDFYNMMFGCNSYIDYEIGRLIEAIEKHTPDALIVFTSDHGDMMGAHGLSSKACAIYDEITRVPLIVKGKNLPAGKVYKEQVSHISLTPTFLEYMGLSTPPPLQGESIINIIRKPDEEREKKPVFMEFGRFELIHDGVGGFQMMRAVFDGRYKLAINFTDTDEMYDLENDPYEMNNIINNENYADIRNKLHDEILEMMNITRDPFRGYQWGKRMWRQEYKPEYGFYWVDGLSRQINIEGYEPDQLEYWTGLEVLNPHQLPNVYNEELIDEMIIKQEEREKLDSELLRDQHLEKLC